MSGSDAQRAVDPIRERLAAYAAGLHFDDLPVEVVHAAKLRIIDTLGALVGGLSGAPCQIARSVASRTADADGATVIGTRTKASPELAAFANATAARYLEFSDFYHWPGSLDGHASDIVLPALAVAEHARASGRDLITAIVLGYEVFLRFCDIFPNGGFDYTNCSVLGSAVAAGKLLDLTPEQMGHCISMAVVPNVILKQVRRDGKTGFKPAATGHAARAGVFAALLAEAGLDGPNLPFVGRVGFCDFVLGRRFSLDVLGGDGTPFKILDSQVKIRPSERNTVPLILAAEKLAPLPPPDAIHRITVEIYRKAIDAVGTGKEIWKPQTREAAYHSIPYVVAAALTEGSITLGSFNENRLSDPRLREIMDKIDLLENEDFTRAFLSEPVEHRARITVVLNNGERLVAETGGQEAVRPDSDERQIIRKFRSLTDEALGESRVTALLQTLLHLENEDDVSAIPPEFAL
ncbi:MmgE/PrpD family protein [Chelativorans alearense]|uniref:MmgE/PrpD family protein n=1 Tax=Chelativorans alearense TaxID=2681495 RepID=UPI0013D677DD|nr:MmgE/PrpD family protein [Chelativorans alearense]